MVHGFIAADWEVDSHTLTHPSLTSLSSERLWQEVNGSRTWLRTTYALPARFFCYPAGIYDGRVVDAVRRAGYLGATTTEFGLAARLTPYSLDRIRVSHGDGVAGLAAHLRALGLPA
jgi:peptidoglycan/xylan/chitin deacetylase (PgdA/CDA1 family)